jgi:hypothetical protein
MTPRAYRIAWLILFFIGLLIGALAGFFAGISPHTYRPWLRHAFLFQFATGTSLLGGALTTYNADKMRMGDGAEHEIHLDSPAQRILMKSMSVLSGCVGGSIVLVTVGRNFNLF